MRNNRRVKIAIAALAALMIAAPAFAQSQQPNSGLGIGVLGGVTFTTVRTETNEFDISTSGDYGYTFGIWFGGNRDGRVGLMGELNYMTKKVKFADEVEEISQELTYIQIPVLLRINTGSRERNKPSLYFLVGPSFDIQIKSDLDGDSPDDFYEGLDIGIMGGVGFEVVRLGIEARYIYGLRSVLGTDAAIESGFGDTKQNTLQILAKVRIN
jgi:hypothetical protein